MEYELGDKILYEYYVIIDGKEYKADKCYRAGNLYDTYSVCYVDGMKFSEVMYREVIVGLDKGYYDPFIYLTFILGGLLIVFVIGLCIYSIVKDRKK